MKKICRAYFVVVILIFDLICGFFAYENHCDADILVIYRIKLSTNWNKSLFPKHYPEFRPPAQWSASHGENVKKIMF